MPFRKTQTRVNAQNDFTLFGQFSQGLARLLMRSKALYINDLHVARWRLTASCSICEEKKMRARKVTQFFAEKLDAHGHDDVAIAEIVVRQGNQLTGGLLVFQLHADGPVRSSGEKI